MDRLKNNIEVALKKRKADYVLKNAFIINVFSQSIEKGDIAVSGDTIVGIGSYEGIEEVNCEGLYVAPGFIDAHVHIESSMVTPEVFSHLVINHGVTTVIADPHEIANVLGTKGIKFMLDNSKKAVMDTLFMLPSCVPAVEFEDNGALLNAKKLTEFIKHQNVLGLGEVMDVGAVLSGNSSMLDKVEMASKVGKNIDGHCPKVDEFGLNAYLCAGINTDHECTAYEEAIAKVNRGMYVMLREGSAAKDLIHLLPAVTSDNYQRFLFCTDDRHIEDLMDEGSIDHLIRLAIKHGLDPMKAYTIASFNAANCYHINDRGAIAPGYKADLVVFEDLENLKIRQVMKNGVIVKSNDKFSKIKSKKTIHLMNIEEDVFQKEIKGDRVYVIKAHPGSLKTSKVIRNVEKQDNRIVKVIGEDDEINKITVLERHKNSGKYYTGFIEGLGLKDCAIAQSISHDSHNVVVVGSNDHDMMIAVNKIIEISGGIVFVSNGKVLEFIELPIAGIMTSLDPKLLLEKVKKLNNLAKSHGINDGIDPYITLSFMALPVIPDFKITPRGLFDYNSFQFVDIEV